MILLTDTATPVCRITFVDGKSRDEVSWEANRELAKGLLGFLETELQSRRHDFSDIHAIGVFRGPGSFTGLRIGLTVMNTLADALRIPIVGGAGEEWQEKALALLEKGENERIVLPLYGSEAHITHPRK